MEKSLRLLSELPSLLGRAASRVVLAAAFFGVVTPIGLVMRLFGRDFLARKRASKPSYWEPKPAPAGVRSYFRQF